MQHGCPCGDERQAWLFGFSDLFGVEGDHGGVVIARLEHNQILAGAEGVGVVVEAQHLCMQMRGVEKQNSITTTSDFTGAFNQAKTREEFMNLIQHGRV